MRTKYDFAILNHCPCLRAYSRFRGKSVRVGKPIVLGNEGRQRNPGFPRGVQLALQLPDFQLDPFTLFLGLWG